MKKAALDPITLKKKGFLGEGFTCTYVNIVSVTWYMQFCFLFFPLVYQMYFSKWQHCFLYSRF